MPNITTYIDKELYMKLQQDVTDAQTNESKIVQKALRKYWNLDVKK